jgi:hypothetical protein
MRGQEIRCLVHRVAAVTGATWTVSFWRYSGSWGKSAPLSALKHVFVL